MQRPSCDLGPVRILPSVSVTNAGYDSNVFSSATNPVASLDGDDQRGRASAAADGTEALLSRERLSLVHLVREAERPQSRGAASTTCRLLGFFNQMSFQATGRIGQGYDLYSSELPSYVFETLRSATGGRRGRPDEIALGLRRRRIPEGPLHAVLGPPAPGYPGETQQSATTPRSAAGCATRSPKTGTSRRWPRSGLVGLPVRVRAARQQEHRLSRRRLFQPARASSSTSSGGYREGVSRNGSLYPEYQTGVGSFFVSYYPSALDRAAGLWAPQGQYSISAFIPTTSTTRSEPARTSSSSITFS